MGTKKVTQEMVSEMNHLVEMGMSMSAVGRKFDVAPATVKTYVSARPPEKGYVSEAWHAPWMAEWDKARKRILALKF